MDACSHEIDEETQEQKLAKLHGNTPMYQWSNAEQYYDLLESDEFEKTVEIGL